MANISHTAAFKAQKDFAPEAKLKVGSDIWTADTAGSRFYAQVLSKKPATVQKAIDLAAALDPAFTVKQVQGHLRWIYTAGELAVDDKTYTVPVKEPKAKPAKEVKGKFKAKVKAAAKPEAKAAATHQRRMVRTKKLTRAA